MDHADLADKLIEARLEDAFRKAKRAPRRGTTHCIDCGVELPEVRQQYELCIECARDHERLEQLIPRLRQ